jgi:chromosome segregation ATPase
MKKHFTLTLALTALLATAVQGSQEQLASSIKDARGEATRTLEQLKTTLDSLTALTKQKSGDLRPAYNTFTTEIPKTQAAATWTQTRLKWMESDGQSYFDGWQKTVDGIANASLRKKAQKRLDAARKSYDKVGSSLRTAGEKFNPFLSDLADIQKVLANDLTASGIKNVKSTVSDANWRYKFVHSAIASALKEMDKMEKSLSPEAK